MPTSSQARILSRRSSDTIKPGTSETMGPLVGIEGKLSQPAGLCNYHQSLMHLPVINLQSAGSDYILQSGVPQTSPRDELKARSRAELPSPTPKSVFNTSNNWPNNAEDSGGKESVPNTKDSTDEPSQPSQPSQPGTSDPPKARRVSKQGSIQRHDSESKRKSSVDSRRSSKELNRKTSSKGKHVSRASTEGATEDSEENTTSRSFTFEVDLLKKRSSDGVIPEDPPPQLFKESATESTTEEPPKHTMKTLFKQLLSIGVMSNAFRGVTVKTASGEKLSATDQETEAALETMITGMVGNDEEDDEEDEMELVMGSLLHNVGSRIEMQEDEPAKPKIKPPLKPPTLITRPGVKPPISKTVPPAAGSKPGAAPKPGVKPPSAQEAGWTTTGTSEMEDILAATALPVKNEPAPIKEDDPEKAFLKEVTSGSLYGQKGKAATLAPSKSVEPPKKKKVFKIPPIRLRRSIPIGNPDLFAIRTPNVDLIHEQVKNMLEAQIGPIVSLQHIPEYLQTGEVPLPIRAMWIFKMEDISPNNHTRICCTGIVDHEGQTLRIRRRDDIFQEEHRAYLLVKQIKEEQDQRIRNKKKGKVTPRSKSPLPPVAKSSETVKVGQSDQGNR